MKKSYKIVLSILISFVILFSPILLAGCGNVSVNELSSVVVKAAKDFYDNHRYVEDYQNITLKWTVKNVEFDPFDMDYKLNADDEEYVSGEFVYQNIYEA